MFTSAILAVLAFLTTPHVPNLEYIFLTYSIPFGIAAGFHECVSVVSLREYFGKQLGLATGIRFAGSAVGPMIFSYLIPIIFDLAGWHTMMTCFSSLGLMFILYASTYKPLTILEDADSSDSMLHTREEDKDKIDLLKAIKLLLKEKRILMVLTGNALFSVVEYVPNMFMVSACVKKDHCA
jgi:MFS family permease